MSILFHWSKKRNHEIEHFLEEKSWDIPDITMTHCLTLNYLDALEQGKVIFNLNSLENMASKALVPFNLKIQLQCFLKSRVPLQRPNTRKPIQNIIFQGSNFSNKIKVAVCNSLLPTVCFSNFRSLEVILRIPNPLCSAIMLITVAIQIKQQ